MTSHEYARRLQEVSQTLLSRPDFDTKSNGPHFFLSYWEKEEFLAAVKALGTGTKEFTTGSYPEVVFKPKDMPEVHVSIARDKVCRIVTPAIPAEYDCEPFLSPEEEASIG